MKKFLVFFVILCILSLAVCNNAEPEGASYYFIGEVTEIYEADEKFLVKVVDYGNYNFNSDFVVIHEAADGPDYAIGDRLQITFNGVFLETAPPQLKNAPYELVTE